MRRILTILLIGLLALFSAPRAEITYDVAGAAQEMAATSHHHANCPNCTSADDGMARDQMPCPHGALCLIFAGNGFQGHPVKRSMLPVDYSFAAAAHPLARVPSLDLPPPRIGSALT